NSPLSIAITNANTNIVAQFASTTNRVLTLLINGEGSVARNPAASFYTNAQSVTATATPDPGSVFVGWSGDTNSAQNPLTLVMNTNKIITGSFTRPPTVAIISPASDAVMNVAEDLTITASASDTDGVIASVELFANGSSIGTSTS